MHTGECSTAGVATERRFWSKVQKTEGCWLWMHSKCSDGYGNFQFRGRHDSAHRVSWKLVNGPIPEGMRVLHRCDVRNCVRPDHLFLGTQRENVLDMHRKGRTNYQRGERHYATRLTQANVDTIRARAAAGESQTALALEYGVNPPAINKIVNWKRWTRR